jgi:hypothetical protein
LSEHVESRREETEEDVLVDEIAGAPMRPQPEGDKLPLFFEPR